MIPRTNPLKNKVIHADIKTQSIEDKSNRPERELANDSKLVEEYETPENVGYKKRAVEMERWWDEAIALNKDLPSSYDHVAVLILKWADELDERRSRAEADKAEAVFRDRFHFSTQILELDVFSKPQHQLHRCLSTFVEEHDGPNNLLIIFYTGHGQHRVDDKYLELAASLDPVVKKGGHHHDARCNWNKAEAILLSEDVECDVLAILDGCYSGKEKEKDNDILSILDVCPSGKEKEKEKDNEKDNENENENENEKKNEKKNEKEESRTFELLTAPAPVTATDGFSFTRVFIGALEYQIDLPGDHSFNTFDLSELVRGIHVAELSFRLQRGRHIRLAPLPRKSRSTNNPILARLSHSTGSYLTLRFALGDESLNPRQIKDLATSLPDVFLNKAHVSLRRIDWLGIKPAHSTQFSRAALAVSVITRWKNFVRRRREERLSQRPVDKQLCKRAREEHDDLPEPKAKREYRAPIFMPTPPITGEQDEVDASSDTDDEQELLWTKASEGYLYLNIRELTQDMDETSKRPSLLSITFECHIPTVFSPKDPEASLKDKDFAEQLFNHVVLIKSPASDGLELESNCSIKATTCREYMERQWPSIGVPLLEQISNAYIDASGVKSDFAVYHDSIPFPMTMYQNTIIVYNNDPKFDQHLFDYLQALDWLCRATRKQLSFGSKDHRISQSHCRISFPVNYPSAGLSLNFTLHDEVLPTVNHNCWQRLFHSCFVLEEETSQGSTPPYGKGLEMSFDLMISLAAVEYPVIVEGGVVFVGYQTILVPTKVEADYAQFHLEIDHNQQINPFTLQYSKRALITDYSQLKSKRCFLGWCEVAHIRLGTQALPTTVKYSAADEKKKSLYFSGLSAGFQCTSAAPIQAGLTGQATFSFRSHCLYFTPPTIYSKMLLDATRHVVLICDVSAQRSWLVPKLSLLIHMAHTWFRNNNPPQNGVLNDDPIPFAEPHVGGAALPQQFEGHGDVVVYGGGTDAFRLRDLLLGFNINLLETKKLTEGSTSQYLYGFEFMDIISEPGKGAIMKKVKSRKSKNWLALANLVDAVVLCSDLGDAITPADCIARKNSFCNSLPVGADYLAAHVSCLAELANRRSQQLATPLSSPQIILSERNLWNVMGDPFGACNHDNASANTCWDRADILQKVCGKDLFPLRHARIEKSACNGSLRLSLNGAVVFGETASSWYIT